MHAQLRNSAARLELELDLAPGLRLGALEGLLGLAGSAQGLQVCGSRRPTAVS